ncbi:MAG: Gfo/Idh/MocA family oxidoreductase [bacterium]
MLKCAVIGVGSLGKHHARILSSLPDVKFEYLVDINPAIEKLANQFKCKFSTTISDVLGNVDACIVSLPTPLHYAVAKILLGNKIHCLVEKPFTTTVQEAEDLIEIAQKESLTLQIGHVERFNPAIIEAQKHISKPILIEVNRLGPFHARATSVGVVLDLMIHDLDIVLFLIQSEIVSVEALAGKLLTDFEDIAKVRLRFKNGAVADLSASRITFKPYRRIRIFQEESYVSIDCAKPSVKIYLKGNSKIKSLSDVKIKKPRLAKIEPLRMELEHFINCCETGRKPLVAGTHGRDALELAWEVLKLTNKQINKG